MKYSIFFDESNKLDQEKKYSYYGALGCDAKEIFQLNTGVERIFRHFGKQNEFHFTEYKNDRNLPIAFCFLHFFINLNLPVNIFIVNNKLALSMASDMGVPITELRKLFYVKIPERLFYGLTREDDFKHKDVNIYLDHSPEYGSMRIYSKIKEQMNAHSLYRHLNYQVGTVKSIKSEDSFAIQIIDMIIGILVFIIEKSYIETSNKSIVKSDLIYRFLIADDNLHKFQKQINLFKWDGKNTEPVEKVPISQYLSEFMAIKTKFDIKEINKLISITSKNTDITTKQLRKELGYSNNMLQLLFGYKEQVKSEDRNKRLLELYSLIFTK